MFDKITGDFAAQARTTCAVLEKACSIRLENGISADAY